MKVKATQQGFYGNKLRDEDDVFELEEVVIRRANKTKDVKASKEATEAQFSDRWMEWIDPPTEEQADTSED